MFKERFLEEYISPEKKSLISGPFGSNISSKYFVQKGIPVIRGNNLRVGFEKFIDNGFAFITQEKADELNCYAICNDLVFTAVGTLGQVGIIPNNSKYKKYTISNKQIRVRLNTNKLNPLFAFYWFSTPSLVQIIKSRNVGSTVPLLNLGIIRKLPVWIPERLEVQEKIAKVLSDLDAKIELNNKINAELEAMAKLIYDYWFVQFEFPFDFAQGKPKPDIKPYKSSGGKMVWNEELKREVPAGWSEGCVSDLFDINPTLSIKKDTLGSYIDMNALPETGFMTKKIKKKVFKGGVKFQNGDVVVARITPCLENGKTGLITLLKDSEVGFGSTEFIVLRGKQMDLRSYGCCLSRSEEFRKYAISKMTGTSGRKRVKSDAIEDYKIPIPNINLLKEFEDKVSSLFEIMTVNVKQNQKLSELRDWLLPMLMNGQVKVSSQREVLNMAAEPEIKYGNE